MFLCSVGIKLFQRREHDMVAGMEFTGSRGNKSSNSSSSSSSSKQEEEMDGSLWSQLPEDLLLSILARLPLESLARLQQVCQDWKSLWQNNLFLHLHSSAVSSNSWFLFQRLHQSSPSSSSSSSPCSSSGMTIDCYDTHTNKWHELKFNHLPGIQNVVATAGSLMLCVGKLGVSRWPSTNTNNRVPPPSYKFLDMVVCNPLKPNSWERIPQRIGSFVPHAGMVADPHTGTYKVILASVEKTEIFDSRAKSWKVFDNFLSPVHDVCSSPVEYRGRLLLLGVGANGKRKVFVYNLEENTCSSFDNLFSGKTGDPFPRFGYLENCGGRLLMVMVTVSQTSLLRSRDLQDRSTVRFERNFQLRVCEYVHEADDLSNGVWRELTSIPMLELESCMSVNSKEGSRFLEIASAASSRNDLLCFTMGMKDGKLDCTNMVEGRGVFLYSLSQNVWCFVRERPVWAHEGVIWSMQLQPSLKACFA